jgi:trehalose synthase
MSEITITPREHERFRDVLPPDRRARFSEALERGRRVLGERVLWHVNSTAQGGGVAEMLHTVLGYLAGAGIRTRWHVIDGDAELFEVTKRIHNLLHGEPGDGGALGDVERAVYEQSTASAAAELVPLVNRGDVVVLHDPQTAGLVEPVRRAGAYVVWSCHVGVDEPNDLARAAWGFLTEYVTHADALVFSRPTYAWETLDADRVEVIAPCIDAFSPKNQQLPEAAGTAILQTAGLLPGPPRAEPAFSRQDGASACVSRQAEIIQDAPLPSTAPLVTQVSRWDRLKDPTGVLHGFAQHVPPHLGAHLVLAGPAAAAVSDDPEGEQVLAEVRAERERLPHEARRRVHLMCIPMQDLEENAAVVNALQRHADVIVQKSLAEGFGLTVAEGMWKRRPVVGSRVGGIQDQLLHGRTGLLVDDPTDLVSFGRAVTELLTDRSCAERMGQSAQERVRDRYLASSHLADYLALIARVLGRAA